MHIQSASNVKLASAVSGCTAKQAQVRTAANTHAHLKLRHNLSVTQRFVTNAELCFDLRNNHHAM